MPKKISVQGLGDAVANHPHCRALGPVQHKNIGQNGVFGIRVDHPLLMILMGKRLVGGEKRRPALNALRPQSEGIGQLFAGRNATRNHDGKLRFLDDLFGEIKGAIAAVNMTARFDPLRDDHINPRILGSERLFQ